MIKVCMFHMGRCGSSVLSQLIYQNPAIQEWGGELFQHYKRIPDPLCHVAQIDHSYGFEIKFFHLRELDISKKECVRRLKVNGFTHFIVLKRKNYLRKMASSLALIHGKWPNKIDCEALDIDRFEIPRPRPVLEYMAQFDRDFKEIDELVGPEALQLVYERDIEDDPLVAYRAVQEFMKLPECTPEIQMQRVDEQTLREMISNYGEVEKYLTGTEYEWMLEEK